MGTASVDKLFIHFMLCFITHYALWAHIVKITKIYISPCPILAFYLCSEECRIIIVVIVCESSGGLS